MVASFRIQIIVILVVTAFLSCNNNNNTYYLTKNSNEYNVVYKAGEITINLNGGGDERLCLFLNNGEYCDREDSMVFLSVKRDLSYVKKDGLYKGERIRISQTPCKNTYYTVILREDSSIGEKALWEFVYGKDYVISDIICMSPTTYSRK